MSRPDNEIILVHDDKVYNSKTHVVEESMHIKLDDKEPGNEM